MSSLSDIIEDIEFNSGNALNRLDISIEYLENSIDKIKELYSDYHNEEQIYYLYNGMLWSFDNDMGDRLLEIIEAIQSDVNKISKKERLYSQIAPIFNVIVSKFKQRSKLLEDSADELRILDIDKMKPQLIRENIMKIYEEMVEHIIKFNSDLRNKFSEMLSLLANN
jgi:hypothetical protein